MLLEPRLFSGSSNLALAQKISAALGLPMGSADVKRFPDGEVNVQINESVRAHDVFILQSTCFPANDHLMEMLLLADACRRASAGRINAVMPYMGYSRQDRQMHPRVPISAKVVANMLVGAGFERVITVDIHAAPIQGFFDIPVDHLNPTGLLCDHLTTLNIEDPVIVSPDAGGVEKAGEFATRLRGSMALIDRRRDAPAKAKSMRLVGDVKGRNCILVDDIIDTGTTLTEAADLLVTNGAKSVRAAATHAVLSGTGPERLERSKIAQLVTTDSIPLPVEKQIDKIAVVSLAAILAESIRAVHVGGSVKKLSA